MLAKPGSIASDPFKSAKWDELTAGRAFDDRHAPSLAMLVEWHAVFRRCIDDMDTLDGQVAYTNDAGELKPLPQVAMMKQASAEIRALNKQLGIDGAVETEVETGGRPNVLQLVSGRRAERRSRAAG